MKKLFLIYVLILNTVFISKAQVNPCNSITKIKCDSVITFSVSGTGNINYPNNMSGQACNTDTSQGGQEQIYRFIVPAGGTGTYQINNIYSNGWGGYPTWVSYYYKRNNTTCSNIGWTCLARTYDGNIPFGAFNWNAGDTILLLLNAETTSATTQTFKINCAANICSSISNIACNDTITFNSFGYGNPNYRNNMSGQACNTDTSQGYQEQIYRFIVPAGGTGTYQINNIYSNGWGGYPTWVSYYYKRNNTTCSNIGWTCLARTYDGNIPFGAFNWNAGDTILLLLNAETTAPTTQTFKINCATNTCSSISNISCNDTITFNSTGYGNPNYPNNLSGHVCNTDTSQGGQEKVYRFVVPTTGTYQINNIYSNGWGGYATWVSYYYKKNNNTCSNTGWTCLARTYSGNNPFAAFNWNVGDTILFLLNAETTAPTTQTFKINCATNTCSSISNISCNDTITFNSTGYGNPNYPNNLSGHVCNTDTSQGGQEKVYRFVVPTTGTYQINNIYSNGWGGYATWVSYYYKKNNNTCSNTGWTCLARTYSGNNPFAAFNWNVGDTILFLLNAETTAPTTQTFKINCATNTCSSISNISCNDTITFNSTGYGNPNYPNNLSGHVCNTDTSQGGQEKVYRFVVPTTGTYQINNIYSNGWGGYATWVSYYYKKNNNTCSNTGWTCLARTYSGNNPFAAFNWNVGDTILFLLNAETTAPTTQTFKINCATNTCSAISNITCNDTITFNSTGYGDPDYPNNLSGHVCNTDTSQGGQEKVYRFVVPTTGTYQINNIYSNGYGGYPVWVSYYYKKNNNTCSNTGWTCLARTYTGNNPFAAFNWSYGDTILFLLNAETTAPTTQTFKINCATNTCSAISNITCNDTITFNSTGYGDPDYPNNLSGHVCNTDTSQGGQEKVYRFVVPTTGTYQINNIYSNGYGGYPVWVSYYYKKNNNTCSNTGWTCLARTYTGNNPFAAFNWSYGDTILFLLNAETTAGTAQTFKITCGVRVCDNIKNINCGDTVKYSVYGYGNPDYPINFSANSCSATIGQGGLEKIYRLPPINGSYQLSTLLASGSVQYLWKYDSICCSNTGWNCIGVIGGVYNFAAITPVPGASVLIMLNSQSTGTTAHNFKVTCVPNIVSTTPSCIYATSTSICKNDSTRLVAQQGFLAPGDTLKWYKGACVGAVIGTGATLTVYPTTTTTYYVRAQGSTTTTNCAQITITVNALPAAPTITVTGPTTFCAGTKPLTLTSSTSAAYQWIKGGVYITGANAKNYKPVNGGTHKVRVTNANGCSSTSTTGVLVSINPLPTATNIALGPLTFCNGDSVTLQANSGTGLTYQWQVGTTLIAGATSQNYLAKTPGTYKVIVTNANLCSKTSGGKTVVVNCRLDGTPIASEDEMEAELFPNPANDNLNLHLKTTYDGKTTICIYNTAGEKMLCKTVEVVDGNYQNTIDVSSFPGGMYMLIIEKDSNRVTERFVKN